MPNEYLKQPAIDGSDLPGAASVAPPVSQNQAMQQQGFQPQEEMSAVEFARQQQGLFERDRPGEVSTGPAASIARGAFATAGSILNLIGAEDWKLAADRIGARLPPEVPEFQDIKDWGDLGTFAIEKSLENAVNALIVAGATIAAPALGVPAVVGTTAGAGLLAAGETAQTIDTSGAERTVLNMVPATVMNTALETFSALKIFKNAGLSNFLFDAVEKSAEVTGFGAILKRAAVETGSSFVVEATTEAAQTYINQVNAELANDVSLKKAIALLPKEQHELINAFMAGGFGAAVTTAGVKAVTGTIKAGIKAKQSKSNAAPVQDTEIIPGTPTDTTPVRKPDDVAPVEDVLDTREEADKQDDNTQESLAPDDEMSTLSQAISTNLRTINIGEVSSMTGDQAFVTGTGQMPIAKPSGTSRIDRSNFETVDGALVANKMPEALLTVPVSSFENGVLNSSSISMSQIQSNAPKTYIQGNGTSLFGTYQKPEQVAQIYDTVEAWRKKYLPDRSIVLGEHSNDVIAAEQSAGGYHSAMLYDVDFNSELAATGIVQNPLSYIAVRPEVIQNRMFEMNEDGNRSKPITNTDVFSVVMSTLSHEVGHAIIADNINKTPTEELSQLKSEHREMLAGLKDKTYGEVLSELGSPTEYMILDYGQTILDMPFSEVADKYMSRKELTYILSFDEYAAEQVAKSLAANKKPEQSTSFWDGVARQLKELYKDFTALFRVKPKFSAWLENIGYRNRVRELAMSVPYITNKVPDELKQVIDLKEGAHLPMIEPDLSTPTGRIVPEAGDKLTRDMIKAMKRNEHLHTGFTKLGFVGLTPLQIAERYKIPEAQAYMESVQSWSATKMRGIVRADKVSKEWLHLPDDQADALGKTLYETSEISDEIGRVLYPSEVLKILKENGLSEKYVGLYNEIQASFKDVLSRLRIATEVEILSEFTGSPREMISELDRVGEEGRAEILELYAVGREQEAWSELSSVRKQFDSLEQRDYFPRMRFGEWAVTVRSRGVNEAGNIRTTVEIFEVYESKSDALEAQKIYNAQYGHLDNYDIPELDRMTDTAKAMYGMPQVVVKSIGDKLRASEGGLTEEQERALAMAESDLSPGKAFLRQLRKRKNTPGFSRDAQRTFSAYMGSASNHLARIEHSKELVDGLAKLDRLRKTFTGDISDLSLMHSYYQEHFKYIFNASNDFAMLRSTAFHWFLGFNVKSAVVNLTQPILVTLPYLSARYGTTNTTKMMAKSYAIVTNHLVKKTPMTSAQQRLLDRMAQAGIIDESAASDLAAMAESYAGMRNNKINRGISKLSEASSFLFRVTEKYNRRAMAIATFELHMQQTNNFEESYKAAVNSIQRTQFEYAKWNRPIFQRNKIAGAALVFVSYVQQFLFLVSNGSRTKTGRSTAKGMLLLALVAGGLQGLPGMDYIFKIINLGGTALAGLLGMEDPELNVEREIREGLQQTWFNPDLVINGTASQYGLGPLHLAELFGAPVPNMNIQGSLSMGSPIPGVREIPGDAGLADYVLQAGGALTSIANSVYTGITSDDPDTWKRIEKLLPVAAKNLSKAARHAVRGAETTRTNPEFLLYDRESPEAWAEIMFEGLGFTASRTSEIWSLYGEQAAGTAYLNTRRQGLMERHNYARYHEDTKAISEALLDIRKWNETHVSKETRNYRITGKELSASFKSKMRSIKKKSEGLPTSKRDRLYYDGVAQSRE